MDRLVCGDVGFGKTEVAVRAAFAVAVSGRQVLVLCPTTILAEQHWNTFRERYRDFPIRVEMVSRFRQPAEVKAVLREFAEGKVDVLVGTHRILSRDVIPKQLGLVVVDEEQRFGVSQKELLRALRLEVDVLSLSATPIPRTLHMSLSGLRDISIIETPPEGRRPIRTIVGELDDEMIRVALEREHAREGQSFYLHNRVETIDEAAEKLRQLCPGLRFLVAHGQMTERELEERMHAFLAGDADVLVSTTIIESGIDIPQANTLVVERADTLGLAQLYQIRGRVGRSDVTAHAYLFYPDRSELTPEARARLATLADHTELGAGFQIAMRDLEIRGAGDLLGVGAVRSRGRARLRALRRDAERGRRRALGPGPRRRAAGAGRRARRRVRPGRLHPGGGAEDRPAPADRARRARGRAARAAGRDRGPLRADPGAGGEPLPDPGSEARARARRRRLPRLPRRAGDRRARSGSRRRSCARSARSSRPPSTRRPGRRWRCAPRAWTGRSGSPLLSLPPAGPPEGCRSEARARPERISNTP